MAFVLPIIKLVGRIALPLLNKLVGDGANELIKIHQIPAYKACKDAAIKQMIAQGVPKTIINKVRKAQTVAQLEKVPLVGGSKLTKSQKTKYNTFVNRIKKDMHKEVRKVVKKIHKKPMMKATNRKRR